MKKSSALSLRAGTNLCGLSRLYFYDPQNRRAWIYDNPPGQRAWVAGGTFCYQREFWRQHSFQDTNEGEDTRFVWANRHANILELPDPNFYVAIIHARNTCPKHTRDVSWHPCPSEQIRELMRGDWPFYDARSVVDVQYR